LVDLPTGTVTFLFTDIEGSTRLWEQQPQTMQVALAHHDALLRQAIETHTGRVFKTIGDGFCAAFANPVDAVAAAIAAQRALHEEKLLLRVRIAVHTGAAEYREGDYFGPALNRVARLLSAGHGGQVLLSAATAEQLPRSLLAGSDLRSLGVHRLRDIAAREAIFQLLAPGLPTDFPPLNTLDVAFRRGIRRAAAVSGAILLVVTGLALTALNQSRRADRQRQVALEGQRTLRRYLYAAQMNVAQQAWNDGNVEQAMPLLKAQKPLPGQEDLRGFEWRYLWRLCQQHDDFYTFPGPKGAGRAVAFSPDGRLLAIASQEGVVKLWNRASRQEIGTLARLNAGAWGMAFLPNGKTLITTSFKHIVQLWDITRHQELAAGREFKGHFLSVTGSPLSTDGRTLTTQTKDHAMLWDVATRRMTVSLPWHKGWFGAAAFSPDGTAFASATHGHTVDLWAVAAKRKVATLRGHKSSIWSTAFSPDGKLLATGSDDNTVKLWDVATRQEVATLKGHRSGIYALAFSADGKLLASGSDDNTAKLWDMATRQELASFKGHAGLVGSVVFSPDNKTLATVSTDGTIKLWNAARRDTDTLRGHKSEVVSVAFSPDSKTLASAGWDTTIRLWDVAAKGEVASLHGPREQSQSVAISPDGKVLAAGGPDTAAMSIVKLWNLPSRQWVATLSHAAVGWA
jgi:WD40 repeat protein/class 3 adenylate cyclase